MPGREVRDVVMTGHRLTWSGQIYPNRRIRGEGNVAVRRGRIERDLDRGELLLATTLCSTASIRSWNHTPAGPS